MQKSQQQQYAIGIETIIMLRTKTFDELNAQKGMVCPNIIVTLFQRKSKQPTCNMSYIFTFALRKNIHCYFES